MNGGAGRVIASIPAFEKLYEKDKDFIIVCEGGMDFYKGHPQLHELAYDHWHKNLLGIILKIEIVLHQNLTGFGNIITKNVV